jgi:hypothetical protein
LLVGNAKTRIPYLFFRLGDQESEMFIIEIGVSALVIALQEFEIGDQIIDLVGVQSNCGISGCTVRIPSASASSRFSTG